jgi:hypothetical protein
MLLCPFKVDAKNCRCLVQILKHSHQKHRNNFNEWVLGWKKWSIDLLPISIHNKPWQNPTIPPDHNSQQTLKKQKTATYNKKKQQRKREKKQTYLLAIEIPNHNKILKLLQLLKKLQPAFLWNWWEAEKEEDPQLSFCIGVFVVGPTTITFSLLFLLVLNFSLIFSTDLNQRYLVISNYSVQAT